MLQMMPKWYSAAEEKLKRAIIDIANENNLKFTFVMDSKNIESGRNLILSALVNIYENAPGEFDERTLNEFKEMKKAMRKNKNGTKKNN